MSLSAADMQDKMVEQLKAAGFSFHNGTDDREPELEGKHWWCWCGPNNNWGGVEVGEDCDTYEEALLNALMTLVLHAKEVEVE